MRGSRFHTKDEAALQTQIVMNLVMLEIPMAKVFRVLTIFYSMCLIRPILLSVNYISSS
ncbi:unnamed protein product [Gongylonema pulchrum]|uniref:Transposase n=1 Tax=Gongylonema pulchrum TaxID=637853 RepID=A0A183DGT1_9BILA|nr:unnamed protein product [Gongylonema pulchrum]